MLAIILIFKPYDLFYQIKKFRKFIKREFLFCFYMKFNDLMVYFVKIREVMAVLRSY